MGWWVVGGGCVWGVGCRVLGGWLSVDCCWWVVVGRVVGGHFLRFPLFLPRRQADCGYIKERRGGGQKNTLQKEKGGVVHLVLGQVVCFGGRGLSSGDCYIRAECANDNSVRRS